MADFLTTGVNRRNFLLIGRIDQVQAAQNKGISTVALTFDQAQLKDGHPITRKSTIVFHETRKIFLQIYAVMPILTM